jgi:hypothetical protein
MTTDIYIKTYAKDFPFLKYCLQSISKFCKGFENVIIVVDANDYDELLTWNLTKEKIFTTVKRGDGYMWQQVCKLQAHHVCLSENILFVDSDCIFFKECTPEDFTKDGKPILLKTKYSKLDDQAKCWQSITERAIGKRSEYEWMRRIPCMYKRSTLVNISIDFPVESYIMKQPNREFSEFNFIGQFIELNEQENYSIFDTDDFIPEKVCEQLWSWHKEGVDGFKEQIENLIG